MSWRKEAIDADGMPEPEPEGTMFGWLEKMSGGKVGEGRLSAGNLLAKWDARWFVLYVADGVLSYYRAEGDTKPLGTLHVTGAQLQRLGGQLPKAL